MDSKNLKGPKELKQEFPYLSDWRLAEFRKHRLVGYVRIGHRTFLYDPASVRAALAKLEIQKVA